MWKTLRLWTRKVVECCKQSLAGHPSKCLEDSSAESNVGYEGLTQCVSEGNSINNWATDLSCNSLAKDVTALFPLS